MNDERYDLQFFMNNYFDYEEGNAEPLIKGRLKASFSFWSAIGASEFVLDIIEHGYKLPLINTPARAILKNNKSALSHPNFVAEAINDLLDKDLVIECFEPPHVVNPLSVSIQSSGKMRLILDLRYVNQFLWKAKISFEDWNTALSYFKKGNFMFSFDLKSGYHHIEIIPDHYQFLGFSWDFGLGVRYFAFQVLPFGLSTAPYVFTKCLRPLVQHWRTKGIFIVVFLDDGWCCADSFDSCNTISKSVRQDLLDAGLVPNVDKLQWLPVQSLDWLGMTWNTKEGFIKITDRRINDTLSCIKVFLDCFPNVSARKIASLAGKIMSLYPVIGNLCQLKSRYMHYEIIRRVHWDKLYYLSSDSKLIEEVFFWKNSVLDLNKRMLFDYSIPQRIVFTDASQLGCGAWISECSKVKMVRNWNSIEISKSSTWRELEAVYLSVRAFVPFLRGRKVKLFTDNKGVVSITEKGSMINELHELSLKIFKYCKENQISLQVQWVPRDQNDKADAFLTTRLKSRVVDFDDWGVSRIFFQFIDGLWGPHSVDRFADDLNAKLPKFNSKFWCPKTDQVDAFSCNWAGENNWLVPSIALIGKVLKHLHACSAVGTLVIPEWQSSAFWPLLFSERRPYYHMVSHVLRFDDPYGIFVQGRNLIEFCIWITSFQ